LKEDLDKYKKENEQLKLNLDKYRIENDKLKADLLKANKIISGIQNNKNNNNELKNLRDEYNKLKYELTLKENEIKDLKDKVKNNSIEDMKVNYKDIMVINFISMDSTVQCGIKCLPTDIFAEVEEKLYQRFDNLRNTNNMFMANAKPVLRFKKISENNIKDGDVLQLHKLE
jgi:predicted nuclease with TOPRIM domain